MRGSQSESRAFLQLSDPRTWRIQRNQCEAVSVAKIAIFSSPNSLNFQLQIQWDIYLLIKSEL
jgi:hypothetical protein